MKNKISVMGVELEILSTASFSHKLKEFLQNDFLNIIFMVSSKTLEYAADNEEFKNSFDCADYVLPSQDMLLGVAEPHVFENTNYVSDFHKLQLCLRSMHQSKTTVFILSSMVRQIESFLNYKRRSGEQFQVVGSYQEDIVANEDLIINEINACTPDIVVLAFDSPEQEYWISRNCTKLNAKLCFVMADIKDGLLKEYDHIPDAIVKMGLQGVYHHVRAWNPLKEYRARRIFKKKLDNYNSTK